MRRGEAALRVDEVDVVRGRRHLAGGREELGEPCVVGLLVRGHLPDGSGRRPAQLAARQCLRLEVGGEQLRADQEPEIRQIGVRNGCRRCPPSERRNRRPRQNQCASAYRTTAQELIPAQTCCHDFTHSSSRLSACLPKHCQGVANVDIAEHTRLLLISSNAVAYGLQRRIEACNHLCMESRSGSRVSAGRGSDAPQPEDVARRCAARLRGSRACSRTRACRWCSSPTDTTFAGAITDLPPDALPEQRAVDFAEPDPDTIGPDEPASTAFARTAASPHRRLVVVGDDARLLGLLCLDAACTRFCGATGGGTVDG